MTSDAYKTWYEGHEPACTKNTDVSSKEQNNWGRSILFLPQQILQADSNGLLLIYVIYTTGTVLLRRWRKCPSGE